MGREGTRTVMLHHLLALLVLSQCALTYNIVSLDSATLPLLVRRGRPAFVRFNKENSYGKEASAFKKLAAAAAGEDLLIGEVGIGTFGEKKNHDLAEHFGYKQKGKDFTHREMKDHFPRYRLFPAKSGPDVDYSGESNFEAMAAFLKKEAGIDLEGKSTKDKGGLLSGIGHRDRNIISLDRATFPLLVGRDLPCLVRFDKEPPGGDERETFKKLALSVAGSQLLLGHVGIAMGAAKETQDIFEKYGYKQKGELFTESDLRNFPKYRFFPANGGQDVEYTGAVTVDAMTSFLRLEANLYAGLQGTLQFFDKLAAEFMTATDRHEVLSRAQLAAEASTEQDKAAAAYYVRHMGFALQNGTQWFKTEYDRIKWILDNAPNMVSWQREELSLKANRLASFVSSHEEL